MKRTSLLLLAALLLPATPILSQKLTEWNRIARPGYDVYAPVTLANGKYGITLTEKALMGNSIRLNGVFDIFPHNMVESSIAAIDFTDLELIVMEPSVASTEQADFLKGKALSKAELTDLQNWQQEFNFREGWFNTQFTFDGLHVDHTVYALKHMLHTGIIKITLTAEKDRFFSMKNFLRVAPPYHFNESKYMYQLRQRQIPLFTVSAHTPTKKYLSATTTSFYFADESAPPVTFTDDDQQKPWLGFEKHLKKGETMTFYVIGSMATTETYADPVSETARLNIYTYLTGPEKVIGQHKQTWTAFWEKTDIVVEGNAELNKDIRQMMFFINSFVPAGTDYSSACMGLGNDFWGFKTLWDADFWIYPALLLINPEAAKSMLEYRWKRLDMARQNALAHGYKGAMFPWESGGSGEEQTSLLYLTGPFQHHITSDVGLAFWRYYCVMQDDRWLAERGFPMLKEVADFWVSRVEKTPDGYEILNVVSGDEHAINVDNDAFTNAGAKQVLKAAVTAAQILGERYDPMWQEVSDGLVIRSFDNGITREHDTYDGETIKQAATNLASFPLDVITNKELVQRNLDYYEPRVDEHGPNMTWPMYAGAAARAGNPDMALHFFEKALLPYKKGPFAILALRPYLTTTFFGTSSGGLLQAFIMGFGGLHFTEYGLVQKDPVLPGKWKSIEYKGIGNNQDFRVEGSSQPHAPANPNATPEARKLLNFLYETTGDKVLSGQHNYGNELTRSTDTIVTYTGETPVVWGSDFITHDHGEVVDRDALLAEAVRQHENGAIITLMFHQNRPYDPDTARTIWDDVTDEEWQELITPGSEIHKQWLRQIDDVAVYLKKLQEKGVPVLWRPYHEMNGGWFWWGAKPGAEGYAKLWKMMYDRYVNYHKLNNLVWVWNANATLEGRQPPMEYAYYYPGNAYVDVLATDIYGGNYKQSDYDQLLALGEGRPIAMGEIGQLPEPSLFDTQTRWTWFMVWARFPWRTIGQEKVNAVYDHPRVVTLEDL